jgi:ATP-dependent DNA helicase RecQ
MQFLISSKEVIRYISLNPRDEEIIVTILRTYPGIYDMLTAFNVQLIAKKSNHSESEVQTVLLKLKEKEIIDYHFKNNDASLIFNEVREDERTINRVSKYLESQNQLKKAQFNSVIQYINEKKVCKSKLILNYFGEIATTDCGICSYCISKEKKPNDITLVTEKIITLLKTNELSSREIQKHTRNIEEDVIFAIQQLLENETIVIKPNNKYTLKS